MEKLSIQRENMTMKVRWIQEIIVDLLYWHYGLSAIMQMMQAKMYWQF